MPRPKQNYTLEETAEYLNMEPVEVLRSRYRGLAPGKFGVKNKKGIMIWKIQDLRTLTDSPESGEDGPGEVVYESAPPSEEE